MPLTTIAYAPGIMKSNSPYAAGKVLGVSATGLGRGRFTGGVNVRFMAGNAEKWAGWQSAGLATLFGTARSMRSWRGVDGASRMMIGTSLALYVWDGTNTTEVTPFRMLSTNTLGQPALSEIWNGSITYVLGQSIVTIGVVYNVLQVGDWIFLHSSVTGSDGNKLDGWYQVGGVTSTSYKFDIGFPITTSNQAILAGTINYQYPRFQLPNNPFTSTAGSAVVKVTQGQHGARTGDIVTIGGASIFNSVNVNGVWQVTVIDGANYTIDTTRAAGTGLVGPVASASGPGGGSVSYVAFDISFQVTSFGGSSAYGIGPYGGGPYGGTTPSNFGTGWTLAPYGGLMCAAQIGGTIYFYDPVKGGRAYPVENAPTSVIAMFVTPERFIVALGTASSTLQMAWSDQQVPTVWTSLPTNTANSGRNVQGGSAFSTGLPVANGLSLILTNRAAFAMQYTGDNEVYSTPMVGDNCGALSQWAATELGETAYWMGDSDFWQFNGTVTALPSDDIRDYVFKNINRSFGFKTIAGTIRSRSDIVFFYVSQASTEIDSYVVYHVPDSSWSVPDPGLGGIIRTAWHDADLFPSPYAIDINNVLYQQEVGTDDNGNPMNSVITSSYQDVSDGDANIAITGFVPDFQTLSGPLALTFLTKYYPGDSPSSDSSFTAIINTTERIDAREDGKLVAFSLQSDVVGGNFSFGAIRVEITPQSARK